VTVQYCTVLCSTVQYCTVLYKTVQHCTVLYSTVQTLVPTRGPGSHPGECQVTTPCPPP